MGGRGEVWQATTLEGWVLATPPGCKDQTEYGEHSYGLMFPGRNGL